jgi:hypothetical protein
LLAKARGLSSDIQQLNAQIDKLEDKPNPKDKLLQEKERVNSLKNERREKRIELRDTTQKLVPRLNFHTERGCAVFYAKDGRETADKFCKENTGCKTIERTAGGEWLQDLKIYECLSKQNAVNVLRAASVEFAHAASGRVVGFAKTQDKESIFWRDEVQALRNNREVTGIDFKYPGTKIRVQSVQRGGVINQPKTVKQAELVNRLAAYEKACQSRMEKQPTMQRGQPRDKGKEYE